jgi:hypothetical protein
MYSDQDTHRWVGFPIRISMDQRLLAAPHGFSQRATSFIASWCQGIHRTPFSCSHHADRDALVVTIPILHRNHPTSVATRGPIPIHMLPSQTRVRETPGPEKQTRHQAHLFSLTLLNVQAAGIRSLDLVRSDLQLLRADAPNPDSQLKEHFSTAPAGAMDTQQSSSEPKSKRSMLRFLSHRDVVNLWWRWTVSNRRPPACKAGALPLSYTPREIIE